MNHREEMLRVFGIGAEDLEANRNGALGRRQARRLIRSGYWNLIAALLIGVGLAAVLYWVARKPLDPVQWIVAGVLFAGAMGAGVWYFRRARAAAAEGRVECVAGPVRARMRGRSGWFLHVADRSFRLPVRPWHVRNDQCYRVYVAPRADVVVAMEPDGWE